MPRIRLSRHQLDLLVALSRGKVLRLHAPGTPLERFTLQDRHARASTARSLLRLGLVARMPPDGRIGTPIGLTAEGRAALAPEST